jgi:hypothetical protein
MSLSASVGTQIPTNVVEVGNEISQNSINAIAASSSPSTINPMMTASAVAATYATKASPTFTGTVTIPAGASISGYATQSYVTSQGYLNDAPSNGNEYVRKNGAWSIATGGGGGVAWGSITGTLSSQTDLTTYVTGLGYIGDAPNNGNEYVRKNLGWAVATGGGGGLTISSLSNAAATTLNATAPTTGQALTFDGTELKWATVGGGGGGATWGSITGTLSTQTDLQTALDGKLSPKTVNTVTGGPYTVQLSDARKVVYLASGGMGFQITADNDTNIAYVDGTEITIVVDNPSFGYSVIAGPGPVTVNGSSSASLTGYVSNLVKVAANTWYVS